MQKQLNEKRGFANNPIVRAIGLQRIVVVLAVILEAVLFSILSPAFRQYATVVSILDYSYYITFMAIGVTFCLISGGNDLSVGAGMICYALAGGYLVQHMGWPVWGGMLVTIAIGLAFGVLNGVMVAIMNLPPFIATLCTMLITRGLGSILTGGMAVSWPSRSSQGGWFRNLFKIVNNGKIIPVGFLIVIVSIILMSIVLNKTRVGRYIIAIGSNKEAARLSGVNVIKYQMLAYIISGFFAGLAGIAYSATFSSSVAPGTGAGLELDAIGGAIIGGTSMTGGQGSIIGTLLGVFVMSLLKTGLPYVGLQANWQQIITGIVLIVCTAKCGKHRTFFIGGIPMKKMLAIVLALMLVFSATAALAADYEIVSKGFQHQYWQAVLKGAEKKAAELGVEINFVGPANESAYDEQLGQLNTCRPRQRIRLRRAAVPAELRHQCQAQGHRPGCPVHRDLPGRHQDRPGCRHPDHRL